MNLDNVWCGDLESDGLLHELNKIHVFSFAQKKEDWEIGSTNNPEAIKRFFTNPDNVVAIHNGIRFDGPAVERVLGIEIKATIIDTLALAWYVDFNRERFGLEWYGLDFNIPKPVVLDWVNISYADAKHRCEEDVKITIKVWEKLLGKLRQVYDSDEEIIRLIKYLNFIMQCSYKQEEQGIGVDIEKTQANLSYFESLKSEKVEQLKLAMPKVPIRRTVTKPKELYKKNGELSVAGQKWLELLPLETDVEMEIITGYEEPNPNSVPQKKAWLYSLGWKPETFKYDRNKETNEVRKIEQILTEEKMLCPSVLKLKDKEPAIEVLDSLSVLTHRIGVLKGFLQNQKDGFIVQGLAQLAVTLRWQHTSIVNLNKVTGKGDIRDGKWIRECLIAGKGKKIVQADLSGIESRTSDHYTFHLNPQLIKETQAPGFDPHCKIAVVAGLMTPEDEKWYKAKKGDSLSHDEQAKMDELKAARHKAKTTNYSCLYQVGAATLSRTLSIPKKEAQKLIDSYWSVHWAVREVTKTFKIKTVGEELWVLNPISGFYHNLRNAKDAFSTVNQSSAVYCFNMWLYNITREGVWPVCQSHDDLVTVCDEKDAPRVEEIINKAMEKLNKQLKLNIELACEVQVGNTLAETH